MGKKKLMRFAEMEKFEHVLQPSIMEAFKKDYHLKGKWHKDFFRNGNPIVLELGCGKGEYTVGLAKKYPKKNFIGIDIKGARMWKGATEAFTSSLRNVAFIRTKIELINSFFNSSEISEIWITFPDPQLKKSKKRLTSSRFLNSYNQFLSRDGIIHVKTDNLELYEYTKNIIRHNMLKLLFSTDDLYNAGFADEILSIKTFYEAQFLKHGLSIKYLKFQLSNLKPIEEPEER